MTKLISASIWSVHRVKHKQTYNWWRHQPLCQFRVIEWIKKWDIDMMPQCEWENDSLHHQIPGPQMFKQTISNHQDEDKLL